MLVILALTLKEIIHSKITGFLFFFSCIVLSMLHFFAGFSVAEQGKFIIDIGFGATTFFTLVLAIYFASNIVSKDIETQRISIILVSAKSKTQYIAGRFLGLAIFLIVVVFLLGLVFGASLLIHQWIIVKQQASSALNQIEVYSIMNEQMTVTFASILKGLWSIYLQALIVTAIALFLSICFNANVAIVMSILIYVIGQIYVYIIILSFKVSASVGILMKMIFIFIPRLEIFNIYEAIALQQPISCSYIGWITIYAFIVCVLYLILSVSIFYRKEIA